MQILIPDHLSDAMAELHKKAEPTQIENDRIHLCAWLLLVARNRPESALPRGKRVPTPAYLLAGARHGIHNGEENTGEVARRYAQGRKASQHVHASAKGALTRLEKVFNNNLNSLPLPLVDDTQQMLSALKRFAFYADPGLDLLKRSRVKLEDEAYTSNSLALLWWRCHLFSPNEQYWRDMFELGKVWGVTSAANLASFIRRVTILTDFKDRLPTPPNLRLVTRSDLIRP